MTALVYQNKVVGSSSRLKIKMGDKELIASPNHRVYVDNINDFKHIKDLAEGDILSGLKFISKEEYDRGEVRNISIEKAQTYFSNRVFSHNDKGVS